MLKRIFKFSTVKTILGSRIYDNYYIDFIMGFCLQKKTMPTIVSVLDSSSLIKIDSVKDYLTITEIFNWRIYKTPRWDEYEHIVDIGANIGCASVFLCRQKSVKSLIAIEPNKDVIDTLKLNIKQNINNINVEIMNVAIGTSSGAHDFFISDSSRYSGFVKSDNFRYIDKVSVECIDFNTLLGHLSDIDPALTLIKIDIEGVERDFFSFLENKDIYIGDIVVEGEDLPMKFGSYVCRTKKFNDVYYYTKK